MASQKITTINKDNFKSAVLENKAPVLVDFWAEWCGPCRMVAPIVDQLAEAFDGRVAVGKVNIDEQEELAAQFGVMSIPTFLVFKDGSVVDKMVGALPRPQLEQMLNKHL